MKKALVFILIFMMPAIAKAHLIIDASLISRGTLNAARLDPSSSTLLGPLLTPFSVGDCIKLALGGLTSGVCGGGSGGGGAPPLQIGVPYNVPVSTVIFFTPDFNVYSDGNGGSTVTVKDSSGPWTADQTFQHNVTLNGSQTRINMSATDALFLSGTINQSALRLYGVDSTGGTPTRNSPYLDISASWWSGLSSFPNHIFFGNIVSANTTSRLAIFPDGANEKFTILSTGKVGIGATSPTSLLDVSGGSITSRGSGSGIQLGGVSFADYMASTTQRLTELALFSQTSAQLLNDATAYLAGASSITATTIISTAAGNGGFIGNSSTMTSTYTGKFSLIPSTGAAGRIHLFGIGLNNLPSTMVVTADGYVGIGITTPTTGLQMYMDNFPYAPQSWAGTNYGVAPVYIRTLMTSRTNPSTPGSIAGVNSGFFMDAGQRLTSASSFVISAGVNAVNSILAGDTLAYPAGSTMSPGTYITTLDGSGSHPQAQQINIRVNKGGTMDVQKLYGLSNDWIFTAGGSIFEGAIFNVNRITGNASLTHEDLFSFRGSTLAPASGTTKRAYGFQQYGIAESNYFAGDFKLSKSSAPATSKLDIEGGSQTIRGVNAGLHINGGTISMDGSGAPASGGALCINANFQMSKCTTIVDVSGNCTCP